MTRPALALAVGLALAVRLAAEPPQGSTQSQAPPPPRPFPSSTQTQGPASPSPAKPPATSAQMPPAQAAAPSGAPTEATLGAPIYPSAEFLGSVDAGRGQRYYLFGTNAAYLDIVTYYRTVLKTGGRELFKQPAMQQFDLPNTTYKEETMAFPPSVVVKDYTWTGLNGELTPGYLVIDGTKEKRFNTVIQIVPAPAR